MIYNSYFYNTGQVVQKQRIHIISFQVPYPADYGGAIDVYYKAKALKESGYNVVLHTFAYGGRGYGNALREIADEVYIYKRNTGIMSLLSFMPYIVKSRDSKELLDNLLNDDAPILFEGAHTTYLLSSPLLKERKKLVRAHNIESDYYRYLATASHSIPKKIFFILESWKLKLYEFRLQHADTIFAITAKDKEKLHRMCPSTDVELLPCFHNGTFGASTGKQRGKGDFILYNGNLSVEENIKAVLYLIEKVAPFTEGAHWIFAGSNPSERIMKAAGRIENAEVIANPSHEEMQQLVHDAAANALITFQATGIKLKLLNTLCNGGHCIVNNKMVEGSGLDHLCTIANNADEIIAAVNNLKEKKITQAEIEKRHAVLLEQYDNNRNIQIISRHL